MDKVIIIRFCEIGLKGKNRRYFENMLISNIKQSLKDIDYTFLEVHNRYVISDFDEMDFDIICDKLKKIAGIHNFSVASVAKNDIDDIEKNVL